MNDCTGRCIAGIVVAIIFGSLFLWTIVHGYHTQLNNLSSFAALPWYLLALVFVAIAKAAKMWGMGCEHCKVDGVKKRKR